MMDLKEQHKWLQKWVNDDPDGLGKDLEVRTFNALEVEMIMQIYTDEQLRLCGVVKSLPTKEAISSVARKKALKYAYANEYVYEQYVKAIEEGANYIKNHIEKQK